jgi:hypothetical protein
MVPFVQVYSWWANGIAGIIPSTLAWLAACLGLYCLGRIWLTRGPAIVALAFFALNPNLLYLQTTAMTEPLFLCEMVWLALWMVEFRNSLGSETSAAQEAPQQPVVKVEGTENRPPGAKAHRFLLAIDGTAEAVPFQSSAFTADCPPGLNPKAEKKLFAIALVLVAAIFTRYDGWIMALLAWSGIGLLLLRRGLLRSAAFWLASALVVAAPIFWFAYNAHAFGDWLFFARGPYSAAAIEVRTATPGFPPHPGWHNPWVSLLFFVKCAELDAAPIGCGTFLLLTAIFGAAWSWFTARRCAISWPLLLLWLPVPFYAYSIAWGSVPIFLPIWWPHSYYNLRYGLELLPALALAIGFAAQFAVAVVREFKPGILGRPWQSRAVAVLLALCLINSIQMLRERPLVYAEGLQNIKAHRPYQQAIPPVLRGLLAMRPGAPLLAITSVDPEIIALTGIPLRQTINESDLWIYEAALNAPASHAAVILAFDGDEIDQAVHAHPEHLTLVQRFTAPGQPSGSIYVSDSPSFTATQN